MAFCTLISGLICNRGRESRTLTPHQAVKNQRSGVKTKRDNIPWDESQYNKLTAKVQRSHEPTSPEALKAFSKFLLTEIEQAGEKHQEWSNPSALQITGGWSGFCDPVQRTLMKRLLELQPEVKEDPPSTTGSQEPTYQKCKQVVRKLDWETMDDSAKNKHKKKRNRTGGNSKKMNLIRVHSKIQERNTKDRVEYEINRNREGIAERSRICLDLYRKIDAIRSTEVGSWEEGKTFSRHGPPDSSAKIHQQGTRIVHIATWNVNSRNPPSGFERLLGLGQARNPDLIILGLQEVTMHPTRALADYLFKDKWSLAVEGFLKRNYIEVATKVLVSVALMVYVKKELANSLREVEASSVTTGFGGYYGSKGGVMVNFRLLGSRFGIVNSHLPAHDGEIKARISDWKTIEVHRRTISCNPRDYLFWMGDLNFRIATDSGWDAEEIEDMVRRGLYKDLLRYDELNLAKGHGWVFKGWKEAAITFKPTFKIKPGTMGRYNLNRRPAWTDRILFKSDTGKEIVNLLYDSVDGFLESDHKPVIAEFQIKSFK